MAPDLHWFITQCLQVWKVLIPEWYEQTTKEQIQAYLTHMFQHPPAHDCLYPWATKLITKLQDQGHTVYLRSQTHNLTFQQAKIAATAMQQHISAKNIILAENKILALIPILNILPSDQKIVFFDDKISVLSQLESVATHGQKILLHCLHPNWWGENPWWSQYTTIQSFDEFLLHIPHEQSTIFLDVDRTLFNNEQFINNIILDIQQFLKM